MKAWLPLFGLLLFWLALAAWAVLASDDGECVYPDCSSSLETYIDERYRAALDATEGPD